jgi:LysM repeat protein
MYNVPPKELASYNHLKFETGLSVGQNLKIPLDKNNFSQTEARANGESLVPVYHIVEPKETLYRLGVNYNKVPLGSLKKWNHLQSDAVSEGTSMIVGFLKVDKEQSSLASQFARPITEVVVAPKKEEKPIEKKPEVIVERKPAVKEIEPVKVEKKEAPVVTEEPKTTVTTVTTKSTINFSGGVFQKLYAQQTDNKTPFYATGSVGVFKSTSGWQDGKYYCFNNDAAPGTIVKVTNTATGKVVYAKVLDTVPDIKQNVGLALILSNAAAEELGAGENKFDCMMSYMK